MSVVSGLVHIWRIVATGFAFSILFLGGSVLAATVFPLIACLTPDELCRARRVQRVIRWTFRSYLLILRGLGLVRLEIVGDRRLSSCSGHLVVANHPTLLDVVILMAIVPNAQCVVKHKLWQNRYLGGVVRAAGYIRNDQEAEALLSQCQASLAAGGNLIIFPEGTRSTAGGLLRFQRGFANIAVRTRSDIQPVTIRCEPLTLTRGEAWYHVPPKRACFRVSALESLRIAPFIEQSSPTIAVRRLVAHMEEFFAQQVSHVRS